MQNTDIVGYKNIITSTFVIIFLFWQEWDTERSRIAVSCQKGIEEIGLKYD